MSGQRGSEVAWTGAAPRIFARVVTSTLDEIHRLGAEGAPHGTVVVAEEQRDGRGRHGRMWQSPPGGLWLAFLSRPERAPTPGTLALRAGLAVAETLAGLVPPSRRVALKWPNDVMLDDKKVGGVLCEARWQGDQLLWIGIGIGVNLRNPVPEPLVATATAAGDLPRDSLIASIATALEGTRDAPPLLTAAELERLARRDLLRGRRLVAPVRGIAQGIAPDGALLVETEAGVVPLDAGSVRLA